MELHIAPKCDVIGYDKVKPYITDAFEYQILGDDFNVDLEKIKRIVLDNPGLTTLVVHENLHACDIEKVFCKVERYIEIFNKFADLKNELNEQGRKIDISLLLHAPKVEWSTSSEIKEFICSLKSMVESTGIGLLIENPSSISKFDSAHAAVRFVHTLRIDGCKLCLDICHAEMSATVLANRNGISLEEARRILFPAEEVKPILGWVHFSRMVGDGHGMNHSVACSNSDEVAELVEKYDYLGLESVTLCMEVLEPDGYEERAAEISQIKSIMEYNKKGGMD